MQFRRQKSQARKDLDYSAAVAAVRTQRAAREAFSAGGCAPIVAADFVAYEPKERLAQRAAQAQQLVENARDIPRMCDSVGPPYIPCSDEWRVQLCIWFILLVCAGFGAVATLIVVVYLTK
jgi:hypothetical protein